jgi:glutamyl-tRNA synthetase
VSDEALDDLARRFALQNAIEHGGEATPGAVIGRIMSYDEAFRQRPDEVQSTVGRTVQAVNDLSETEQQAELEKLGAIEMEAKDTRREGLPELPNADQGEVVMRFAPNPNGAPSLGHARGMCINGEYADEYQGTLLLRFDDTDPVNKRPWLPAYEMFEKDFAWLDIPIDRQLMASDRLETYYEHAEEAMRIGAAYTCECDPETFREYKNDEEACPHRDDGLDEQKARWEDMHSGSYRPGECVLRVKTDMQHPDPALRDWVAFRLVNVGNHPHPRTGEDFRVWPLLDFQSAIDDHLEGTTHIIRGKDLADSEKKQKFLYEHFGWAYPEVLHWGRVAIHEFGTFSTSTMSEEIAEGKYEGWDDVRLPTLRALRRRGFLPQAIRNFWVELGLTEKDIDVSFETLEAKNRKLLDERADRLFFVHDPTEVRIDGLAEPVAATPPRHPDDESRGHRNLVLEDIALVAGADWSEVDEGTILRLKDACAIEKTGPASAEFVARELVDDREGPILEWTPAPGVECRVLRPDASTHEGRVEATALEEDVGTIVQFERYGFARLEAVGEDAVEAVFGHR